MAMNNAMMKTVPRSGWVWSGHETRAWLATCARQLAPRRGTGTISCIHGGLCWNVFAVA